MAMVNEFGTDLFEKLSEELLILEQEQLPQRIYFSKACLITNQAIKELREFVRKNEFVGKASEIHFFKNLKPKFIAELIFLEAAFCLETNRPVGPVDAINEYFSVELAMIHRFIDQHRFLFDYYRQQITARDEIYFISINCRILCHCMY